MTTYGGSQTNFDPDGFTLGAVAGSAMIAGAIGRGIANLKRRREGEFASWSEPAVRAALDLSEAFRASEHSLHLEREAASAARVAALELLLERERTRIKLALARLKL